MAVGFFGAGASYHAIPSIDGLTKRFDNLIKYLEDKNIEQKVDTIEEQASKQTLEEIIEELKWLLKESDNHQTVDTLAKKFYILSDDDSLCRLKRALMVYFFFEQNILFSNYSEKTNKHKSLTDKRYDNLIASIAGKGENGIELKGHIKFITWNYDLQIDLALRNYFNSKFNTFNKIKNELNIHPNKNSYDLPSGELIDRNKFATFKLNGNAFLDNSFDNGGPGGVTINDYRFNQSNVEIDIITAFLTAYSALFKNNRINSGHAVYKYFNFAWEKEDKYLGHNNVIGEAIKIMQETNVLIVVGYSFPYFNSEIDKKLFAQCLPKEIIIQDLEPEHIKERLSMLLESNGNSLDGIKVKLQKPDKYFPIHPET